nr:MAG TPA: hypothetical protein [Caudoviricetes sp.]
MLLFKVTLWRGEGSNLFTRGLAPLFTCTLLTVQVG